MQLAELDQPAKLALLRRIWTAPESFRPKKTSRDITEAAARSFATLAEGLRKRGPAKETDPQGWQTHADEVAHFLTQCLFCFFAEDVGLLPGRMFEGLVNNRRLTSEKLTGGMHNLFSVMRDGGLYGNDDIPWFNGGLFKKIKVPPLSVLEMTELRNAAGLNWSATDVSIFGTLFERGLDPGKCSQLGAHVIPLGMEKSPYLDRIVPKNGHEKELAERTLTKLYNQRPAWLDAAHQALDAAVAAAYGWLDYRADMPDEDILKRLLALNLQRSKAQGATKLIAACTSRKYASSLFLFTTVNFQVICCALDSPRE